MEMEIEVDGLDWIGWKEGSGYIEGYLRFMG